MRDPVNSRPGARAGQRFRHVVRVALGVAICLTLAWSVPAGIRADDTMDGTPGVEVSVVPTDVPPTATDVPPPPTDIPPPPTDVPPPPAATEVPPTPTEISPTPTDPPTVAPTPTIQVWENHDTLVMADGQSVDVELAPGAEVTYRLTYRTTTPRTGTTIRADLQVEDGDPAGWQTRIVSLDGLGDDWSAAGIVADGNETTTLDPDLAFEVTIAVRAPADVIAAQTALLHVGSVVTALDGATEAGVADSGALARVRVVPPPTPTPEPACEGEPTLPVVQTSSTGFGSVSANGSGYPTLRNTTTVTVSLPEPDSCLVSNWNLSIVAGAMTSDDGGTIPASDITFQGVAALPGESLADAGLPAGTALDVPQVIVTGTSDTLDADTASTTFGVIIDLLPPVDAPPGTYRGEIVVDSFVAP